MKSQAYLFATTLFAASASIGSAATLLSANFDTDQSTSFTTRIGVSDASANFNYDYSAYVPQAGTTGPTSIPTPPSGGARKGLKLDANHGDATGAADAITVFPNVAGLSSYVLKYDLWMQFNGDGLAGGGTGSSEFLITGAHAASNATAIWASAPTMTGFFWTLVGEGGFLSDARYYSGTGAAPVNADTVPNWLGGGTNANNTNLSTAWQAVFPAPTYEVAGTPGKQWTVIEQVVNGANVVVWATPTGGSRTQLASWSNPAGVATSGLPFVGYGDFNTSVASPAADNFGLIDNLSISTIPAAAEDWSIYQ